MNEFIVDEVMNALENWAKNFDGKATEFVILCSARRIINELTKENERLHVSCTKLERNLHDIEDKCASYMKDYFKCRYAELEAEVRAETVRKMQEMLCEGRVSNDNVVIVANQVAKEMLEGEG